MNLKLTFLKSLLEDKELEKLEKAVSRDKIIIPSIIKIVQHKLDSLAAPLNEDDFISSSWAHKQAFREGKKAELLKLKSILEE